ncbi:oxidoreductase [Methanobrevibacter sp. YE315]|uniref:aldo/keto reductase n=1 Tax=Methanobrevibacter sp. YE315 TaxID=1609968 RepID=UPI000764EFA7|nr:aldo/keto reductase [Methanobrevibacter sp. YE315]AMD17739.1 oxidoreductase [Methanobrevibacter sp. YE315]
MKYVKLGNSNLKVSKVCMGCMGFGDPNNGMHTWTLPERESIEIISQGMDSGINFFDTAIGYQNGTSEQYLGKAIRENAVRDDIVVATKFLPRSEEEIKNNVSGQRHIHNFVEKSLENLGLDYIDLYIYHMWDYNTPMYDILEGLNEVIDEGKVRYIGISNCFAWQLAKANALAESEGFAKFVSVQGHYNLIFREEEREMIPLCKTDNIATTPYSSLASGRLSRLPGTESKRLNEDFYAKLKYESSESKDLEIIKRVDELAQNYGVSMTEVSLAWLLTKITSPIVGATKTHHVEGAVNSVDLELSDDDIGYLEEPYVAHDLVGVMADNKVTASDDDRVWAKHTKVI